MGIGHEFFMHKALELATKGWPAVAPNPMVGCVIVYNDEIVASGYHQKFGDKHAEVVAIENFFVNYPLLSANSQLPTVDGPPPPANRLLPPASLPTANCILYVTLEPCSHYGKTPPCADLIISKGFKAVVVACLDPNPLVSGNGVAKLRAAGVEVITGVLEKEARELNKRFITYFEKKRPYYILKWAQTADGFIGRIPVPADKTENKISGNESQQFVHTLRSEVMGILVGKNTVLNDNPQLTTRLVPGKNPVRIFIDKDLEVPITYNVYNKEARTIIFNAIKNETSATHNFVKIDFNKNVLEQVSAKLYDLGLQSVLVEGGGFLLNDFITRHLWDEALVFQNPQLNFGQGIKAPAFAMRNTFEMSGEDKLYRHFNTQIG